ncbi:hypothetical protein D3C85_1459500 [compost metagenome]
MFDLVGHAHIKIHHFAVAQVDVTGLDPVLGGTAEEMLLQRHPLDAHAATGAHQGLLEFGVAANKGVIQLRRQLLAGVPGASGGCDGDGDSQAGKDAN